MKTDKEIYKLMDEAEKEITDVLIKYGLTIGAVYDGGVGITLRHDQRHPSGDYSVVDREAFVRI